MGLGCIKIADFVAEWHRSAVIYGGVSMHFIRYCAVVLMAFSPSILGAAAMPAAAQSAASTDQSSPSAYDIAIQCFIVNGDARHRSLKANDQQSADHYNQVAESDFNVAIGLGKVLGYSKERMDADIDAAMKSELPRLRDPAYLEQTVTRCRAYQLM